MGATCSSWSHKANDGRVCETIYLASWISFIIIALFQLSRLLFLLWASLNAVIRYLGWLKIIISRVSCKKISPYYKNR